MATAKTLFSLGIHLHLQALVERIIVYFCFPFALKMDVYADVQNSKQETKSKQECSEIWTNE